MLEHEIGLLDMEKDEAVPSKKKTNTANVSVSDEEREALTEKCKSYILGSLYKIYSLFYIL